MCCLPFSGAGAGDPGRLHPAVRLQAQPVEGRGAREEVHQGGLHILQGELSLNYSLLDVPHLVMRYIKVGQTGWCLTSFPLQMVQDQPGDAALLQEVAWPAALHIVYSVLVTLAQRTVQLWS